jgi:integrase
MNTDYQVKPSDGVREKMNSVLAEYWGNDIWDIRDPAFDNFRPEKLSNRTKKIDFSILPSSIRDEFKFMLAIRLIERDIRLPTVLSYRATFISVSEFFNKYYPKIKSIIDIPYEKLLIKWNSFAIGKGYSVAKDGRFSNTIWESIIRQPYIFFQNFYDSRDEYDKDVWDCRKIAGAKVTENQSDYLLTFTDIPKVYRNLVKRFIKYRTVKCSQGQCRHDINALRFFTNFIVSVEPEWTDLRLLKRNHIEDYMIWFNAKTEGKQNVLHYWVSLRIFLDYIQRAMYPEAPEIASACLIYPEDLPKEPIRSENSIKYIPEDVLRQLEDNLDFLTPEYIPIVILLRSSGWRISDILNLKYDKCLQREVSGWYLCGDILKTQVLNHRVPITDEVAAIVMAVIEEVKEKSTVDNNPNHLLFPRYDGKRMGRCIGGDTIRKALNRLAKTKGIVDDKGIIFHFRNHAFRHTKGIELINNGMPLVHVQKWMAHASPEMTLRYAKILDSTMRKSWEETVKHGLFRVDDTGKVRKIDISEIQNEDVIEWEYIRSNLDAVRMPLGFCMKPNKQECHAQLNPCLTCRSLCTTPDFIPQYEIEIQETKILIERGIAQGRNVWVEKNSSLLEKYVDILRVLKEGKTHHLAGKKGREYIKEERIDAK